MVKSKLVSVSVIMPAYNSKLYIAEAIDSVVSQTFSDWELIIVDDASHDETIAIIMRYLDDPRIILFRNERNLGGAATRNRAIEMAHGQYIAFLDSDDVWAPDKLERQIAFMKKNTVALSFGDSMIMSADGTVYDKVLTPKKVTFSAMLKHNYIVCSSAVYDTERVGKVFMPIVRKRQDFALWIQILKICGVAYSLSGSLCSYRVRPGSLSENKKEAFFFYWKVLREVAGCNVVSASFNIMCYLFIVFFKKKLPNIYNDVISRNG